MDLSRWKSGWAVAALSVVAVALITFFLALRGGSDAGSSPAPVQLVAAQDLTSQVRVEISDPQFDSAAGRHYVHATVVNRGDKPLVGPIVVSPYAGLKLADPDGQFDSGKDYVTLVPEGKQLERGERIQSRRIALRDGKQDRRTAKNFRVWRGLALSGAGGPSVAALPGPPANVGGAVAAAMQPIPQPPGEYPIPDQRIVNRVMAIQDGWAQRLFAIRGVHGTSTGLMPDGEVVIRVVVDQNAANNLPRTIEGVRVDAVVGGPYRLLQLPPQDKVGQGGAPRPRPNPLCTDDPQVFFARPVPIGVSALVAPDPFNIFDSCAAGTLGARVRGRDGRLYALSNNHVFANSNRAAPGDKVYSPSPGDNFCFADPSFVIGTLADFEPIKEFDILNFIQTGQVDWNVMDAAIIEVTAATVSNRTPCSGYGVPNSAAVHAVLGMKVEKYGRTTAFQTGTIISVNSMFPIAYPMLPGGGLALAFFRDQIEIFNTEPLNADFGQPGDSGSLIVTAHPNLNPVGLLFAGADFGPFSITSANPIIPVLERFNVAVDGAPSNFGPAGR